MSKESDELQATVGLMWMVDVAVTHEEVRKWGQVKVAEAEAWAGAVHLSASDNDDVVVPTRPAFLPDRRVPQDGIWPVPTPGELPAELLTGEPQGGLNGSVDFETLKPMTRDQELENDQKVLAQRKSESERADLLSGLCPKCGGVVEERDPNRHDLADMPVPLMPNILMCTSCYSEYTKPGTKAEVEVGIDSSGGGFVHEPLKVEGDSGKGPIIVGSEGDKWSMDVRLPDGRTAMVRDLEEADAAQIHAWLGEWLQRFAAKG